jgi:crotonobetainyl-CoA:carnitine CoA-transferase CaiB-like acyl-CoA transferase
MEAQLLPLEGIRIVELAEAFAMPFATKLLADMGAEVIKIESWRRLDASRVWPYPENRPGEQFWNQGALNHEQNRGKYVLGLDLGVPEGKEVFLDLVRRADVVAENYTPRVLKNFGLDYERLRAVKPDLIMISSTGFGHSGPWTNYSAFGSALEPTAGISHLTGYPDGPPIRTQSGVALDMMAAPVAAFAILAALRDRRRTGEGQWIDLAQYEVGVHLAAPAVLDFQLNGVVRSRIGNRHETMAPHGLYPTRGEDRWIAIAVRNDAEFAALCAEMGRPDLAEDDRFADLLSRYDHQDDLDAILADWTRDQDGTALFHRLQAAGIAAAPVFTNKEMLLDPHLRARGYFVRPEPFPRAERVGRRPIPGIPFKFSKTPGSVRWMAPPVGEHNEHILKEVLGHDNDEIQRLYDAGALGKTPPPERLGRTPVMALPLDQYVDAGVLAGSDPDYRAILGLDDEEV